MSTLREVWDLLETTTKRAKEMETEGKRPNPDGLIVALLQVIAWELRTARELR